VTTNQAVKISILMDNRAKPGFLSEHGFSVWIESNNQKVLFDTGTSDALSGNAENMGINLLSANQLVLSHGHYDHTGYVAGLLHQNPQIKVLMHPKATQKRYSIHPEAGPKDISMPPEARDAPEAHASDLKTVTEKPHQLESWLGSSGTIPRTHPLEDTGGPFSWMLKGV